ncbi:hypothetical protein [Thioalkalivibrio sp. ALJ16]|uniref:hypothetical protein n=1 Tax=Thioalkalivibrio sp. ALJ16 TaxID=1158762 RepID=UPI0003A29539|nr:hypothetical protein [Thioalkalivibrio sp. ALJ16]
MPGKSDVSNPTPKTGQRRSRCLAAVAGWALAVTLLGGIPITASADILRSPDGGFTVLQKDGLPVRGQTQTAVIRDHGEPETRHATVGDPPITRWDYTDFSVFFEGEYVLHSAVRGGSRSDRP